LAALLPAFALGCTAACLLLLVATLLALASAAALAEAEAEAGRCLGLPPGLAAGLLPASAADCLDSGEGLWLAETLPLAALLVLLTLVGLLAEPEEPEDLAAAVGLTALVAPAVREPVAPARVALAPPLLLPAAFLAGLPAGLVVCCWQGC
jgi:hypothetical protein